MVKTGIATQRVSPRDTAMMSDDIDISETSNSAKRSCRQNISDGCTMVGRGLIPCGAARRGRGSWRGGGSEPPRVMRASCPPPPRGGGGGGGGGVRIYRETLTPH